jgi:hypothetical protein
MKREAGRTTKWKTEPTELRGLAEAWRQVVLPMVAGIVTTKKAMRDWVTDFGMAALLGLMEADAERAVGAPKGAHRPFYRCVGSVATKTRHGTDVMWPGMEVQYDRPLRASRR